MSNESGDSDDLEALFDSIVEAHAEKPAPAPEPAPAAKAAPAPAHAPAAAEGGDIHSQIGHLTRALHDTMRELGYDKTLERAVGKMPDTRDRLNYISQLTEQAAVKTLNAVEDAKPLQQKLESGAAELSTGWQDLFERKLDTEQFKTLVHQTRSYLQDVPLNTKATNSKLMDIVVAQDYQDLTGQVLKKLADTVQQLENQLVALLIESLPEEKKKEMDASLLNGPVINSEGRSDVVTSQAQVDDLLESLGF
ncbi:chemotaxis regulator CheZ [mine drainage metagenome]|uniref:Protein phosphatase CheZ n=1 Tax=mine drainage metagenome TaxID=410659 RepID=A0A1J5QL50_9ZZZZ